MSESSVIRFGRVVNIDDPNGGGRIQVRTPYDNPKENNEELMWCIPLLPKMLHVIPKVGELVLVFSMSAGDYGFRNFFIGPLISQEDKLLYESHDAAMAITKAGIKDWAPNPRTKKGVQPTLYPAMDDISLEGRKNTGVQLKDNEVRIKAGVKVVEVGKGPKNNTTNPAFISLKYYPENDDRLDGFKSTATIVADKINLIGARSEDSNTKDIPVTENKDTSSIEKDNLISDAAMKELINKAHRVPFGDVLVEFLDIFRTAFAKHVHPFPTMAPCDDDNVKSLGSYDLDGILSNNVRIN